MTFNLIIIPLVGALIGWVTNYLAIRMLFRPHQPVKIPILNFTLQGLIPKRKEELAAKIGEAVENQLVSGREIIRQLAREVEKVDLAGTISPLIKGRVMAKIPPFIPISVKALVGNIIEEIVRREAPHLVSSLVDKLSGRLEENLQIGKIAEERVKNFSLPELENLILSVAAKELRHIEILGAVLGFLVGLVQDLILLATI